MSCLNHVFYSLLFRKEHLEVPLNQGEKRESLVILEKVGLVEGLLKSLGTEALVTIFFILIVLTYSFIRLVSLETRKISSADKHCI